MTPTHGLRPGRAVAHLVAALRDRLDALEERGRGMANDSPEPGARVAADQLAWHVREARRLVDEVEGRLEGML